MTGRSSGTGGLWLKQLDPQERTTLIATFGGWLLDGMDVMVYSFVLAEPHHSMAHQQRPGGSAGHQRAPALLAGRMVRRPGCGSLRPRTDPAGHHLLVCPVYVPERVHPKFFSTPGSPRLAGTGVRRRVGGGLRAGRRDDPCPLPRPSGGQRAGWLGSRLGSGCPFLHVVLQRASCEPGLAGDVLGRYSASPPWHSGSVVTWWNPRSFQSAAKPPAVGTGVLQIFSPGLLRVTLLASLVALGAQGGYYAITTFLPLYLNARGLSVTHTGGYLLVIIVGSFSGYLTGAALTDALGRRATLILFAGFSFLTILLYTALSLGSTATLILGFPLGFFASGSFSPLGRFLHGTLSDIPAWLRPGLRLQPGSRGWVRSSLRWWATSAAACRLADRFASLQRPLIC